MPTARRTITRVQDLDDETNYLLSDGSRTGASAGVQEFTNNVKLPASPADDRHAISRGYSLSKLMNLMPNGSGLLNSNYNFSGLTFDATETHGGGGSFKYTGAYTAKFSDEYIPVDVEKYYRLIAWAQCGDTGGGNFDASNRQYLGVVLYDADFNTIAPHNSLWTGGSALTTLASDLNTNDTTITLTDATGWQNGSQGYNRQIAWWPYTNALGYTYPDYTYTRNTSYSGSYTSAGLWGAGGISGNTLTLTSPWPFANLPSGTPVRNSYAGFGTYKYIAISYITVPNAWTKYEGYIGGENTGGTDDTNLFHMGAAYLRLVFLLNFSPTASSNIIRYSDVWLSELSVRNLERFNSDADLVVQSYTDGTRPVAGTAGRIIFNTTDGQLNIDNGTNWTLPDGTVT